MGGVYVSNKAVWKNLPEMLPVRRRAREVREEEGSIGKGAGV